MQSALRYLAVALFVVALAILGLRQARRAGGPERALDPTTPSTAALSATGAAAAAEPDAPRAPFPHALRDPAKREELRQKLLLAAAAAEAEAAQTKAAGAASVPVRGERQTNDLEEFGRFVAQAIREDFVPMAKACAKELAARKPDAGGTATIAFELLGDSKIGGVVSEAEVKKDASTLNDEAFETCVRESLYGVYFDPPPAGGRATLNFPITVGAQGAVDDDVEDFHLQDKR